MTIELKKSNSHWIKIIDTETLQPISDVEFLIDYPSVEQEQKLQEKLWRGIELEGIDKENVFDFAKLLEQMQFFLKYTIKDWKGLEPKCKLVKNELANDIWWGLVKDSNQCVMLYNVIKKELELNEADKKK